MQERNTLGRLWNSIPSWLFPLLTDAPQRQFVAVCDLIAAVRQRPAWCRLCGGESLGDAAWNAKEIRALAARRGPVARSDNNPRRGAQRGFVPAAAVSYTERSAADTCTTNMAAGVGAAG